VPEVLVRPLLFNLTLQPLLNYLTHNNIRTQAHVENTTPHGVLPLPEEGIGGAPVSMALKTLRRKKTA